MFEPFSGGYYLGRLYVEPGDGDRALVHRRQHEQIIEEYYDGTVPPVMKLDRTHLAVGADAGIPENTLVVPTAILDRTDISNPPSLEEILLAKEPHAQRLFRLGQARRDVDT